MLPKQEEKNKFVDNAHAATVASLGALIVGKLIIMSETQLPWDHQAGKPMWRCSHQQPRWAPGWQPACAVSQMSHRGHPPQSSQQKTLAQRMFDFNHLRAQESPSYISDPQNGEQKLSGCFKLLHLVVIWYWIIETSKVVMVDELRVATTTMTTATTTKPINSVRAKPGNTQNFLCTQRPAPSRCPVSQ